GLEAKHTDARPRRRRPRPFLRAQGGRRADLRRRRRAGGRSCSRDRRRRRRRASPRGGDARVTSPGQRFKDGDAEERRLSIVELGETGLGGPEDVALLTLGLGDEDWRVRKESVLVAASRVDWGEPLFERLVFDIT